MVIRGRNSLLYVPCEAISHCGGCWAATICTGANSVLCFTWSIDVCSPCNPCRNTQAIYNYVSAKIMEGCAIACGVDCASNQRFERIIEWGRCLRTLPVTPACISCAISLSTFRTFQCGCACCGGTNPEGVAITRFSSGAVGSFTADCGGTYSPPAQATITISNIEASSDVWIFKNPSVCNTTPLASQPCCVCCPCACNAGKFKFTFTYCTPFCGCFQIKVINLCFQEVNTTDAAGCANSTVRVQQSTDRNYDDPC